MHRAFQLASAIPWAISPQWLTTILTIANREGAGPDAVATQLGRPLENTHEVTRRGNVAIIPVHGPIFRRANVFSQVSGATSVQVLATDLHLALDAEEIEAVVLDIDSPGGEANGISEFAAQVFAGRSRKPIHAYVGGTGASAAYWIAAACTSISVADTAVIGSIGVVQAVPNPKAKTAADIEIVSAQSPNKRPDVTTDEGRAVLQAEVDALASVFVSAVATYRGTTPDVVLEKFGKGGCLVGAAAKAAGMVDHVTSFEALVASLTSPTSAPMGAQASVPATALAPETAPMALHPTHAPKLAAEDDMPPSDAPASEPDGDEPKVPAYAVGDAVMAGERPAEITEVRNGPHYALTYTDEAGGDFAYASEDDLAPAGAGDEPAAEDMPDAEDSSPAAAKLRAMALENARLRAALARKTVAVKGSKVDALIAKAKADRRIVPASEGHLRTLAGLIGGNARAFAALSAFVASQPVVRPLVSVKTPPARKDETVGPLSFNGKAYAELTFAEKHALFAQDPDLGAAMQAAHQAAKAAG